MLPHPDDAGAERLFDLVRRLTGSLVEDEMPTDGLSMSARIRRTAYTDKVEALGVRGFSVVNHMLLPKAFARSVEEEYWHLREHVQMWDVSCQRQVEIRGRDAARLVQWMTPRNIGDAVAGQCLYAPLVDQHGGMINDPILLKHAADWFWFSIADSDVLLWAQGLALGAAMEVSIVEPDVSPLAIQGPKAEDLMAHVFGQGIREVGFFRFAMFDFQGTRQLIARSGYSRQGGFEIYLRDSRLGTALWDTLWDAGQAFNLRPGCPNLIERIEGGLLSFGNEMTRENNPLECGLGNFCELDGSVEYIGLDALQAINTAGIKRRVSGVIFDGGPCPICAKPWPVTAVDDDERALGQVTSAIYSPRLAANVGLGMIATEFCTPGQRVRIHSTDGMARTGTVTSLPIA